jgi:hypothetical protein
MLSLFAVNGAQAQRHPRLVELESLPVGLEVLHTPNPTKAQEGVLTGFPYGWRYETAVRALGGPVRIEEFGSFAWQDRRWVFTNFTGEPFYAEQFAEWYSCPEATVTDTLACANSFNWTGNTRVESGRMLWYFIGVDEQGRRVKGQAVAEQLGELTDDVGQRRKP